MTAITVVGSINLDLVASGAPLPLAGETVTGAVLGRHPGGKGANQALAARRLGADVVMVGRVGDDAMADEALALLAAEGVDLARVVRDPDAATGVALIAVSPEGENQISVCAGANWTLSPDRLASGGGDALICQLELPCETVAAAVGHAKGFVCLNLAPAAPVPDTMLARADLVVVNEGEAAFYGDQLSGLPGLVAVTLGARGARLMKAGAVVAECPAPAVQVIDTTGAGDAFVGALTLALVEGQPPDRALRFACAAGALAATRAGAQPALPRRDEVEALLSDPDAAR